MSSLTLPARALIDPVDTVPVAVRQRRWMLPLLILVLASAFSALLVWMHWEAEPDVIAQLQRSGMIHGMSEQAIQDKVALQGRITLVSGVAMAVLGMPLIVLLIAVALKFVGWLLGRSGTFKDLFAAVAVGSLPIALGQLALGIALLRQPRLSMKQIQELLPSNLTAFVDVPARFVGVAQSVDFFTLWSVALIGLGFAAATGMRRWKSLLLLGFLYALFVGVVRIGLAGSGGM